MKPFSHKPKCISYIFKPILNKYQLYQICILWEVSCIYLLSFKGNTCIYSLVNTGSLFYFIIRCHCSYYFLDSERKLQDDIPIENNKTKMSQSEEKSETEENVEMGHGELDAVCSGESAVIENEETVSSVVLKGMHEQPSSLVYKKLNISVVNKCLFL